MEQELTNLKVVELRSILKDSGLKVGGKKTELIERIISSRSKNEITRNPEVIKKYDTLEKDIPVLSKDMLFQIALELDLPDLFSFCLSSKRYNEIACNNKEFWRAKLIKNNFVRRGHNLEDITDPKKYYELRNQDFKLFLSKKLLEFSRKGELKNVIKALDKGADPNYEEYIEGEIANSLVLASSNGKIDIVKYLIKYNPNYSHYMLGISLIEALKKRHYDIAKYLIQNGADPHFDDDWPIGIAILNGDKDMVKFLNNL